MIDKNGAAAGGMSAIDIPPAIANEEAFPQVDRVSRRRAQKHAGFWFSAIAWFAMSGASVETNLDAVEKRDGGAQFGVHRFDGRARLRSTPDIGLVSHDHEKEPGLL